VLLRLSAGQVLSRIFGSNPVEVVEPARDSAELKDQESVPAPLAETALPSPAPASQALPPRSESGQRRSNRPSGVRLSAGRLASFRSVAAQDYVDMIVPPHYSAAPSGDLCTTLRLSFVVRGESKENVPTTGDRPQRLPAAVAATRPFSGQLISVRCNSVRCNSAPRNSASCQPARGNSFSARLGLSRDSERNVVSRYGSEGSQVLPVEYNRAANVSALNFNALSGRQAAGRQAAVLVPVSEQMKHDPCNAFMKRAVLKQSVSKQAAEGAH
jgi:hypothetical protein